MLNCCSVARSRQYCFCVSMLKPLSCSGVLTRSTISAIFSGCSICCTQTSLPIGKRHTCARAHSVNVGRYSEPSSHVSYGTNILPYPITCTKRILHRWHEDGTQSHCLSSRLFLSLLLPR